MFVSFLLVVLGFVAWFLWQNQHETLFETFSNYRVKMTSFIGPLQNQRNMIPRMCVTCPKNKKHQEASF